MKVSVPEFLDEFVAEPMPIEVRVCSGKNVMTYVGCPTNWDAFEHHMKAFKDTEVFAVSANGDKLVVHAM